MADRRACAMALRKLLGPAGCLLDAAALRVYSRDASDLELGRPLAVTLPATTAQVAAIIDICSRNGVAHVARGAGTGLSGGAVPPDDAVVLSLARLQGIHTATTVDGEIVTAEAGVTNAALNRLLARDGGCFAPDPSSQEAATIGGNVATNAGGPHCLSVGTTVQHVRDLHWLDDQGRAWRAATGGAGFDLTPLLVGSEGTLGVVTAADLAITPLPEATTTLLAYFGSLETAVASVSDLLGAGLLPAAMEVIDGDMLVVVEEAFGFGFRTDADAAMILELAGPAADLAARSQTAAARLSDLGADVQIARDRQERLALWRCRKRAFGAVGRLAPNYLSLDVAVPIGRLPGMIEAVRAAGRTRDVRIATALHAGDGNLHPGVMYDAHDPDSTRRARAAAADIVDAALARGGTVSGEHGIGMEKLSQCAAQLDPTALDLMHGVKNVFDPRGLCNPGKALPQRASGEAPPPPTAVEFAWESLTVSAPASLPLVRLQRLAAARGFGVPVAAWPEETTVGHALLHDDHRGGPGTRLRDAILEVWAVTGDGREFHVGRPVPKNVVGYDLPRLLCGSRGCLAVPTAVSLTLRPAHPTAAPGPELSLREPVAGDGVPLHILQGLKTLFDPERRLFTPPWLEPVA